MINTNQNDYDTRADALPGRPLSQADLQNLASSYITPELAEQALLRRVDTVEGARVVGRRDKLSNYAGMLFAYVWPGEHVPREYRLRRDQPDLEYDAEGKLKLRAKYVSPPGRGNLLYFVPGADPALLSNASVRIAITEGEKKTLALHRLSCEGTAESKLLPIGLSGVYNWRGKRGKAPGPNGDMQDVKGPIADLDRITWTGRAVYIVFDANAKDNESVAGARRGLTKELQKRGAVVHIVDIPQIEGVNGIDDFLAKQGADAGIKLLQNTRPQRARSFGCPFRLLDKGVFYIDPKDDEPHWVCSKLEVVAATRNSRGEEWGRLLRFTDLDGVEHEWAMPMDMLAGDGSEYRSRLLSMGLKIAPGRKAKEHLTNYIQTSDPGERALCVSQVGWHDGVFVLPDETFGQISGGQIIFQSAHDRDTKLVTAGALDEWREHVGEKCRGNSRLIFAASCAFAAPLLSLLSEESAGFHFRGGSSTGKTTALLAAGSVWWCGRNGFAESWRSTTNGLEAIAESHNDGLLCLDELGQVDPRDAGDIAYLLGNGVGKLRMTKSISARRQLQWRLIYLSAGEISLAEHARSSGKRIRGGQEVRLVDIDADAGHGMGLFECIHGHSDASVFAMDLTGAAMKFYGTPIREFLKCVIRNQATLSTAVQRFRARFLNEAVPVGAGGEVKRVAGHFAIIAAAGEMAIADSIMPGAEGDAERAARTCFQSWLNGRGTQGSMDVETAISQVRSFLEAHGASRFQELDMEVTSVRIISRAGFKDVKTNNDETVYYILPEAFRKEVCAGYDYRAVAKALNERGLLEKTGNRFTVQKRLPEVGRGWVYAINSGIFDDLADQTGVVTPMTVKPAA